MTSSDRQLALVYAAIAQMNCEVAAGIALNKYRENCGHQIAYDDGYFIAVANKYEPIIGYNAIASIAVD